MNSIQKPNDILIATLSAPQANVVDLLQNNINVDNTSILTPEEYKQTPFVQQRYTQNGVFNEDAFNQDYLRAYANYTELANAESYNNLSDYLTYAPQDRFAPMKSRKWDVSAEYKKIHNPLQRAYSVQGINTVSAPTLTPEEAAQSNHIFDPETGKFINETPETLNIFKKAFGQTLVYAKWESDGSHINPQTGVAEFHKKGQWKTDENGNYYTEFLGDRELLDKQVVALGDIITDEGTLANRFDFFDSDGYDKSAFGTAMKAMLPIAFYLIPGVNSWYATLSVIGGLASVMPTFYKSFESIIGVDKNPLETDTVTLAENWFRKFTPSKSYKGRESFWTWESMAELVADVWGQAHQQRAAAKAANWFMKAPKKPVGSNPSMEEVLKYQQDWMDFAKSKNKLGAALSRGYMSLISTADMYNVALQSGYDKDVAGWAALMSAAGMYGIMHINETTMNLGTWMLDKTTGYTQEASRGAVKKLVKDRMDEIAKGVKEMRKGYKQPLADTFVDFRKAIRSKAQDIFVIGSEDIWKNAIIEGVEEVTEEMVQDAIKGVIDAMNSVGLINQEGATFGGWKNVFSREGLSRYLATFVGGGIGGGLFSVQRSLDNKFNGTPSGKNVKYTLRQAILDGRLKEVVDEFENHKKFYNQRQGVELGEIDGQKVYLTGDATKSQADVIYERAMAELRHEALVISRITQGLDYDPKMTPVYGALSDQYEKSGLRENYIKPQWDELVQEVAKLTDEIQALNSTNKDSESSADDTNKLKDLQDRLKEAQEKLNNWNNGENFADFTLDSLIFLNKQLAGRLMSLDVKSYAHNKLGVDYDNPTGDWTKAKIDEEFKQYQVQAFTKENLRETLPKIRELLKKTMPSVASFVTDFVQNENNKLWLKNALSFEQNQENVLAQDYRYERVIDYLQNNPKYWSLSDRFAFDLASQLEAKGIIDIEGSGYTGEQAKVVRQLINDLAIFSHVNVWTKKNVQILMNRVNEILEQKPDNNVFIVKLNDLNKEESDESKSNSMIDVALTRVQTHFDKFAGEEAMAAVENVKLQTILDLVSETDEFIDEELYHLLEVSFSKEIAQRHQDELNYMLTEKYFNMFDMLGQPVNISLQEFLSKGLFKRIEFNQLPGSSTEGNLIVFETDLDFSDININNVSQSIANLKKLRDQFRNFINSLPEGVLLDNAIFTENGNPVMYASADVIFGDLDADFTELIDLIENQGILPEELQQKWNAIQGKTLKENPVLSMVKSLSHKFGINNDSLLEWLWDKENKVLAENYMLSDTELEDIKNLSNVLNFAYSLLACMQLEGSDLTGEVNMENVGIPLKAVPLPFNGVVRNYYNLYNNGQGANLFPVFTRTDLKDVQSLLSNLEDKLLALKNLNTEKFEQDSTAENAAKYEYLKNTLKLINEESLTILHGAQPINIRLLSVPEDEKEENPENLELYVAKNLSAFGQIIRDKISANEFTEEEFIQAVITKFPKAFEASESLIKSVEPGKNSDNLNYSTLIDAVAVDYGTLYKKLSDGLNGKSLDPRPGQEQAIKGLIAFCENTEFYAKSNQLLFEHFKKFGEEENKKSKEAGGQDIYKIYKTPLNYTTRIQGAGGTGKSTIVQILVDALKPKKLILTAPTDDKVSDLKEGLKDFPQSKLTTKTVDQLIPERLSGMSDDFIRGIQAILSDETKLEKGKTTVYDISVRDISIEVAFTKDSDGKILGIQFTENGYNSIKNLVKDEDIDMYSDSLIILDENSNIDQLTLAFFNAISEKSGAKFVTLGDNAQIGTTFQNQQGIDFIFNISAIFTHRVPALQGVLRAKNSGIYESLNVLHQAANQYVEEEKVVMYDESTDTNSLINKFRLAKMKYKGLMGVQVVQSSDESQKKLKEIKDVLDKDPKKSFVVIYEPTDPSKPADKPEELVRKLQDLGFPESRIKYRTLKSVQGAEADFVYVYGLTSAKGDQTKYPNGDTDMQKAYTAVSRGKEFVLVEDTNNGLFKAWGITSIEDPSIDTIGISNQQQMKEKMDERKGEIDAILSVVNPRVSGTQVDLSDDEAKENIEDDPEAPDSTLFKPNEDDPVEEPEKESDLDNLSDDEEAINNNTEIILKNAVKVYGYYTRLGITREAANAILQSTNEEETAAIMQPLWDNASEDERVKDFLAYWNLYKNTPQTGAQLISGFLKLRNKLLYGKSNDNKDIFISIKRKDDTDFSFLKPNDKDDKDTTNGRMLTTVLRSTDIDGKTIYITIGRTGMNKADGKHSFSRQLKAWQKEYFSSGRTDQVVYRLSFKGPDSQRQAYYDNRQVKKTHIDGLSDLFVYQTGLKVYEIDPKNPLNDWLLDPENYTLPRTSVATLEQMGYDVKIIDMQSDFKSIFNKYRFADDLSDEKLKTFEYLKKYKWVLVTPSGVEASAGNSRLFLIQDSKHGTIWDNMPRNKKLNAFYVKSIISYLNLLWGNLGDFAGLSTQFYNGKRRDLTVIKPWIDALEDWKSKFDQTKDANKIRIIDGLLKHFFEPQLNNQKYQKMSEAKDRFLKELGLDSILSADETKGWMFDYVTKDVLQLTSQTRRVPEAPDMFLNFNEYESDGIKRNFGQLNTVESSVGEPVLNNPLPEENTQTPLPINGPSTEPTIVIDPNKATDITTVVAKHINRNGKTPISLVDIQTILNIDLNEAYEYGEILVELGLVNKSISKNNETLYHPVADFEERLQILQTEGKIGDINIEEPTQVIEKSQELETVLEGNIYTGSVALENGRPEKGFGNVQKGDVLFRGTYNGNEIIITSPIDGMIISVGRTIKNGSTIFNIQIKQNPSVFTESYPLPQPEPETPKLAPIVTQSNFDFIESDGTINEDKFIEVLKSSSKNKDIAKYIYQLAESNPSAYQSFKDKYSGKSFDDQKVRTKLGKVFTELRKLNTNTGMC